MQLGLEELREAACDGADWLIDLVGDCADVLDSVQHVDPGEANLVQDHERFSLVGSTAVGINIAGFVMGVRTVPKEALEPLASLARITGRKEADDALHEEAITEELGVVSTAANRGIGLDVAAKPALVVRSEIVYAAVIQRRVDEGPQTGAPTEADLEMFTGGCPEGHHQHVGLGLAGADLSRGSVEQAAGLGLLFGLLIAEDGGDFDGGESFTLGLGGFGGGFSDLLTKGGEEASSGSSSGVRHHHSVSLGGFSSGLPSGLGLRYLSFVGDNVGFTGRAIHLGFSFSWCGNFCGDFAFSVSSIVDDVYGSFVFSMTEVGKGSGLPDHGGDGCELVLAQSGGVELYQFGVVDADGHDDAKEYYYDFIIAEARLKKYNHKK